MFLRASLTLGPGYLQSPALRTVSLLWFQVWMLTGDKLETATCTAKNAHLVTRNQDIHVFRLVKHPAGAVRGDACIRPVTHNLKWASEGRRGSRW